jgi:hypothetical protein
MTEHLPPLDEFATDFRFPLYEIISWEPLAWDGRMEIPPAELAAIEAQGRQVLTKAEFFEEYKRRLREEPD